LGFYKKVRQNTHEFIRGMNAVPFLVFLKGAEAVKTFRIYLCFFKLVRALENKNLGGVLFIKAEGS